MVPTAAETDGDNRHTQGQDISESARDMVKGGQMYNYGRSWQHRLVIGSEIARRVRE